MTGKEQIIIDINKYFVELIDKGGGTVGYTVMFPERLLIEIIKQNKQLARKTQEYEELKKECEEHKSNAESYCNSYQSSCKVNGEITRKMFKYKQALNDVKKELKELKRQYKLSCLDCEYKNTKADVDRYRKALEEIEKAIKINCEEICGRKFEDCNDTSCFSAELLDIINKVKGNV